MTDEEYMKIALEEARKALEEDEVPVGAIIVFGGKIIGRGHNQREKKNDISSHAEIETMKEASSNLGSWDLSGCSMYVTLEPCLMCSGAILQSKIDKVVFASLSKKDGAIVSKYNVFDEPSNSKKPLVYFGILQKESSSLLEEYFQNKRK